MREELEPKTNIGGKVCTSHAGGDNGTWTPYASGLAGWQRHKVDLKAEKPVKGHVHGRGVAVNLAFIFLQNKGEREKIERKRENRSSDLLSIHFPNPAAAGPAFTVCYK